MIGSSALGMATVALAKAAPMEHLTGRRQAVFERFAQATRYYEPLPHTLAALSLADRVEVRTLLVGGREFVATRVQDEDILGRIPRVRNQMRYKGGIRMMPNAGPAKAAELALEMSLKTAVVAPPLTHTALVAETILMGGGKATIMADPKTFDEETRMEIGRRFVREFFFMLADGNGNPIDCPAPDVNTDGKLMAVMTDEYNRIAGRSVWECFTGKPLELGGCAGRPEATGRGLTIVVDRLLRNGLVEGMKGLAGQSVAIDGFGNVGTFAAEVMIEYGARVMAWSDSRGAVKSSAEGGFTARQIREFIARKEDEKRQGGTLIERNLSRKDLVGLDVDVLVLGAPDLTLTGDAKKVRDDSNGPYSADSVRAKVVAEGGNGMTDEEGDAVLAGKGVVVAPDILANAGGVIVSGFEIVQNRGWHQLGPGEDRRWWTRERTNGLLAEQLVAATDAVSGYVRRHGISVRDAAMVKAMVSLDEGFRRLRAGDSG